MLCNGAHLFQLRIRSVKYICAYAWCLLVLLFIIQLKRAIYHVLLFDFVYLCWPDKNFMQFQCGRNIIYHIDADELFVSHYDNFIVCNAKKGEHHPLHPTTLCQCQHALLRLFVTPLDFCPEGGVRFCCIICFSSLVFCVELLVKCL